MSSRSTPSEPPAFVHEAAQILKAIAHPIRLGVVAVLVREGPTNVGGLAERLDIKQPIVSQQLRILRVHRLVGVTRENGYATYRVVEPHLEQLISCMESCCLQRRGA
jgi:DNA-binding transcriptional ArsR family regulator